MDKQNDQQLGDIDKNRIDYFTSEGSTPTGAENFSIDQSKLESPVSGGNLKPSENASTTERKPVHFREWIQVIAHTHSKMASLAYNTDFKQVNKTLQNWQDGQFTTEYLLDTSRKLGDKKGGFFIVDTEHAAHSADFYHPKNFTDAPEGSEEYHRVTKEVRNKRREAFEPGNLDSTIGLLSANLLLRKDAIEKLREARPEWKNRIFSGVEVDILPCGRLDIDDQTLLKLDYVGASYHTDEFKESNNGNHADLQEVLHAYEAVASNPSIDVLNHCVRELQPDVIAEIEKNPECFDSVFQALAKNNKALEINLRDMVDPKRKNNAVLALKLAVRAKATSVKLILGADFHRLEQYLPTTLPDGTTQESAPTEKLKKFAANDMYFDSKEEADEFEQQIVQTLSQTFPKSGGELPGNFLKLARPIYRAIRQMQNAGINSSDIVNGNIETFRTWMSERKQQKLDAVKQQEIISELNTTENKPL